MPDNLILSDCCLLALAKDGELLQDESSLVDFLEPWHGTADFAEEILVCIQKTAFIRNILHYPPKPKERPFSKLHEPL